MIERRSRPRGAALALCLAIGLLPVLFAAATGGRRLNLEPDNVYMHFLSYQLGDQAAVIAALRENDAHAAAAAAAERPAVPGKNDFSFARLAQAQLDYAGNYPLMTAVGRAARLALEILTPRADLIAFTMSAMWLGIVAAYALAAVTAAALSWRDRRTALALLTCVLLAFGCEHTWHGTRLGLLSPHNDWALFGLTPRNMAAWAFMLAMVFGLRQRTRAAYVLVLQAALFHGTVGLICLAITLFNQVILQPQSVRRHAWLSLVVFAIAIATSPLHAHPLAAGTGALLGGGFVVLATRASVRHGPLPPWLAGTLVPLGCWLGFAVLAVLVRPGTLWIDAPGLSYSLQDQLAFMKDRLFLLSRGVTIAALAVASTTLLLRQRKPVQARLLTLMALAGLVLTAETGWNGSAFFFSRAAEWRAAYRATPIGFPQGHDDEAYYFLRVIDGLDRARRPMRAELF